MLLKPRGAMTLVEFKIKWSMSKIPAIFCLYACCPMGLKFWKYLMPTFLYVLVFIKTVESLSINII